MAVHSLFKYGSIGEHSESLFSTNQIWFSSPYSLNDPFECRPWYTFDGSPEQILEVFVRIVRRHFPQAAPDEIGRRAEEFRQTHGRTGAAFWDNFRTDVVNMIAHHVGLLCLTTRNTNIVMWSHYGDDHKGFALEFEATDTTPFFGEAQQVGYSEAFPVVEFFNTPHEKQVDLIFLTKYVGWKYEEEYRIVDHQSGPGLRMYPAELLKSVTFGLRMSDAHKEQIRTWLKKRTLPVQLYQAAIDQREFKIIAVDTT